MTVAQLIRQIRKHEQECQRRCESCRAKLSHREEAIRRQIDAEADIRELLRGIPAHKAVTWP
ncbi:MAG: hypothetical protein JWO67_1273 [Streptosporangiaceae bacterium]|nr:hypothetical protein [Streptosporangiaceae bacterium]